MPSIKLAGKAAFSLFVLAGVFYLIDANDVFAVLAGADSWMIVLASVFALSAQVFSAVRLTHLARLQDISLTFLRALQIGLSAVFYGLVVPAGSLAAFAARFIQMSRDVRIESVVATLIMDRIIATTFLLAIGMVAISFDRAEPLWAIAIVSVGIFLGIGLFVLGRRLVWHSWDCLDTTSSRFSSAKLNKYAGRVGGAFLAYSSADGRQIVTIVASTLMAHLSGCLVYFTIAESLDLQITLLSACWIRSGMILFTMIPLSVAGLGLREIAAVALLVPLGIADAQAVGLSILVFLVTPVIVGLIGGSAEFYRVIRLP